MQTELTMEAASDSESIEFSKELQSQTHTILSSNDNSPMEILFSHFFNTNNNRSSQQQHSHSLTFFQCCKKHHPHLLFIKLIFLLRCSPTATTRANAARAILFLKPSHLWPKLNPTAQAHLKAHLIQFLKEETSLHVIRLASLVTAETVSAIYNCNNRYQQHWPEIFSFILSALASNDDKFLEVALLILSALPKRCRLMLSDHNRSLHGYLLTTLSSTNPDVKTASFSVVVSLVCLFYEPSLFHDLLRAMMVGVFALLHGYEGSYFRKAFKELINLVSEEPSLLKPYMSDMVLDVLQIAENSGLSKGTHCLAFELVMAMTGLKEFESVLVNLEYDVMVRVFKVLMNMLMCVEEDTKRDSEAEVKGEVESEVDVYKFGMKCLNQICVTFGGSKVVAVAHHVLKICMDSSEWKMRHAGITMLVVIAKQFSDEMVLSENFLGEVVTTVLKSFQDSHVQVRLAAFNFMETPSHFVQVAHVLYHHKLMHAFAIAIDNGHNDKVKEQAASAMLFFLKNTLPESLTLYKNPDTVMTKLLSLLQGKESAKQRSLALSAFNIVAQQCQAIGHRHYANYLPILLEACSDKSSEIKEEAIRGIRICAEFGTPQFKPFVNRILSELSILIQAQNHSLTTNAKVHDIAVSALGRICEFHRDSIDGSRIVPSWLSLLPLKEDLIEAKVMHEQLCLMVSRLDKDLLGAGNQNLFKIIEVFLEVIGKCDKLASSQTVKKIQNLLRQFGRIIPRSALETILLSLNAQQRELLLPLISS